MRAKANLKPRLIGFYTIDPKNKRIRRTEDPVQWAKAFGDMKNRRVAFTKINKRIEVSTVFVGLDMSGGTKPMVFETKVFGGRSNDSTQRYSTWKEAELGHKRHVQAVRRELA